MSSVLTLTVSQLSTNTFTQKLNSKVTTIRRSSCVLMLSLWSQVVLIDDLIVDASQEAETIQSGASVGLTPRREKKANKNNHNKTRGLFPRCCCGCMCRSAESKRSTKRSIGGWGSIYVWMDNDTSKMCHGAVHRYACRLTVNRERMGSDHLW